MTRKKNRIASPAYSVSVSRFATAKLRCVKSSSFSIGSSMRRSYQRKATNATTPASSGTAMAGLLQP